MIVKIVSPENTLYESDAVESVMLPGEMGRFEVLQNHAPIVSLLMAGEVVCRASEPFTMQVAGGFVEVANNVISICVEV